MSGSDGRTASYSGRMGPAAVVFLSLVLVSSLNRLLAFWLGFSRTAGVGICRRVGPETGPHVFCAGSSLLESALYWSKLSEALGQGIETWGRVFAGHMGGVADADPALSHRILEQCVRNFVRLLFSAAGNADKVLVGPRSKVAKEVGLETGLAQLFGAPSLTLAYCYLWRIVTWSTDRVALGSPYILPLAACRLLAHLFIDKDRNPIEDLSIYSAPTRILTY